MHPLGKKICLSFLVTLVFCLLPAIFLFKSHRAKVLPLQRQTQTVPNITARVGEYQIGILSGWASPYAEINLNGQGTARKTTADENGYFEFQMVPVKKSYGELCLTSQDVNLLFTPPVCLPAIPPTQDVEVIGVLLPPTISLDKGKIPIREAAKASGMTFPSSEVDVYLFENKRSFLSKVYAAGLPKYTIKSNENGYYEFSLPTTNPSENRLFAVSFLSNLGDLSNLSVLSNLSAPSPKSNTLVFRVFKPNWLWLILSILSALSILSYLRKKKKPRALLIPQNDLVKSPAFCNTNLSNL